MLILNENILNIVDSILCESINISNFNSKIKNLEFKEEYNRLDGKYNNIEIIIKNKDINIDNDIKNYIIKILNNITKLEKDAKLYLANQFIDLKNTEWKDKDDKPVTKNEFISKLKLKTLYFRSNYCEFWFDDDGLFYGHSLIVDYNNNTFTNETLAG